MQAVLQINRYKNVWDFDRNLEGNSKNGKIRNYGNDVGNCKDLITTEVQTLDDCVVMDLDFN